MTQMTLRVYDVDTATGARTEISRQVVETGDPRAWDNRSMDNFPPCACPSPACKAPRNPVTYHNPRR